MTLSNR